jgi:hypothetical protein
MFVIQMLNQFPSYAGVSEGLQNILTDCSVREKRTSQLSLVANNKR